MIKIYARREEELRLLPLLAEFKARVIASFPIKGRTRKVKGKNAYKILSSPLGSGDAQHPARQAAIEIIEAVIEVREGKGINGEEYYALEDKITSIITDSL